MRLARRSRNIAAMNDTTHHEGWLAFAGTMILIAAVPNCIWGIAAIDKANFFRTNASSSQISAIWALL